MEITQNQQLATTSETASTAMAVQAKAMVEARYIIAMKSPRNWDQVRQDLIKECQRPAFANNKSAWYVKPMGGNKTIEGLGVRFVEVAMRCMKNVLVESNMIFEDTEKEIHRVTVTDLEANLTYPLDVKVSKTVERSKPNDDGTYISVRLNSYGKQTYTVQAGDDDLLNKRGAMISKALRTLGLRIIPGDLQDEAEDVIKSIRLAKVKEDPDAARKALIDNFSEIGVNATSLTEYLGHDIGNCSPAETLQLRGIYGAIRDGEASWKQVMENKGGSSAGDKAASSINIKEEFAKAKSHEEVKSIRSALLRKAAVAGAAEEIINSINDEAMARTAELNTTDTAAAGAAGGVA